MKMRYTDVPEETRKRAVTLYSDNGMSLVGVANALGLTRPITRKIILEAGAMRESRIHARDKNTAVPNDISVVHSAYLAGAYDVSGGYYTVQNGNARYMIMLRGDEDAMLRVKSIAIAGNITKGPRNSYVYRITKQVDVERFCRVIAPYSLYERQLLYVAKRIEDENRKNEA